MGGVRLSRDHPLPQSVWTHFPVGAGGHCQAGGAAAAHGAPHPADSGRRRATDHHGIGCASGNIAHSMATACSVRTAAPRRPWISSTSPRCSTRGARCATCARSPASSEPARSTAVATSSGYTDLATRTAGSARAARVILAAGTMNTLAPAVRQRRDPGRTGADARSRAPIHRQWRPGRSCGPGSRRPCRPSRPRRRWAHSRSRATIARSSDLAVSLASRPYRCRHSSTQAGETLLHLRHGRGPRLCVGELRGRSPGCRLRLARGTDLRGGSRSVPHACSGVRRLDLGARQADHGSRGRGRVPGRRCQHGVVDHRGEVYGNPGLFVVDGAALPAPVGGPPSVAIASWAHHVADGIARATL